MVVCCVQELEKGVDRGLQFASAIFDAASGIASASLYSRSDHRTLLSRNPSSVSHVLVDDGKGLLRNDHDDQ